jgi:hypothetical protein
VGWIGAWIDLPVLGYWHEDFPDAITASSKGELVVKYKPAADRQLQADNRQISPAKKQKAGARKNA